MIILEGPDGSGKTTLLEKLRKDLNLPIHERGVNSDSTTVLNTERSRGANLSLWAYNDVSTMDDQPMAIYDRHCLISEYIYGPVVRSNLDANMRTPTMHLLIREMAKRCLVIFCRPPDHEITKNIDEDPTSLGVVGEKSLSIAHAYDALKMFWPGVNLY